MPSKLLLTTNFGTYDLFYVGGDTWTGYLHLVTEDFGPDEDPIGFGPATFAAGLTCSGGQWLFSLSDGVNIQSPIAVALEADCEHLDLSFLITDWIHPGPSQYVFPDVVAIVSRPAAETCRKCCDCGLPTYITSPMVVGGVDLLDGFGELHLEPVAPPVNCRHFANPTVGGPPDCLCDGVSRQFLRLDISLWWETDGRTCILVCVLTGQECGIGGTVKLIARWEAEVSLDAECDYPRSITLASATVYNCYDADDITVEFR